ncbi:MAG TPA: DUF268 domain-containing protein [Ignavibacteriaceae bacterium]|nr:DUF268 domain-containing protein [Ignavibacteriaceae bacterium]
MKLSSKINLYLKSFGIFPDLFIKSLRGISFYIRNKHHLRKQIQKSDGSFLITNTYPCLADRFEHAGSVPLHYFHQDLFIANKIFQNNPVKHVDVGSRIDGFIAHVASFRKIEVLDLRDLKKNIYNVKFIKADLMDDNFTLQNYSDSLSCLHAIEHFGLGRYGDKVDLNGHLKGFEKLHSLLKNNGKFYFSTTIGPQRIEFDAHRVFSLKYLLKLFENKYEINSFSYINDKNIFFENAGLTQENINNNFFCHYGCGIFEMTKV